MKTSAFKFQIQLAITLTFFVVTPRNHAGRTNNKRQQLSTDIYERVEATNILLVVIVEILFGVVLHPIAEEIYYTKNGSIQFSYCFILWSHPYTCWQRTTKLNARHLQTMRQYCPTRAQFWSFTGIGYLQSSSLQLKFFQVRLQKRKLDKILKIYLKNFTKSRTKIYL